MHEHIGKSSRAYEKYKIYILEEHRLGAHMFELVFDIKIVSCIEDGSERHMLEHLLQITLKLKEVSAVLSTITKEVDSLSVYIILEANLKIVEKNYFFFNNSNNSWLRTGIFNDIFNKLFASCQSLQCLTISIINNNMQDLITTDSGNNSSFAEIVRCLCSVGEFVDLVDVKTTANVWKCISQIGTESAKFVTSTNIATPWLSQAVEFLCNEILQSVSIILENSTKNDNQFPLKLERILKVDAFYLKIIAKFASDYSGEHFEGFEGALKLVIFIYGLSEDIYETMMGQKINEYVVVGVKNLLYEIYRSRKFEEYLIKYQVSTAKDFESYCTLVMDLMEHIIMCEDDNQIHEYFCKQEDTVFDRIFGTANNYGSVLLKQSVYERLTSTMATIVIISKKYDYILKKFDLMLLNGLLSNDILTAFICYDIICILFRFATDEGRRTYLKFFLGLKSMTPILSFNSTALFLKSLIQSFLTIISDDDIEQLVKDIDNNDKNSIMHLSLALKDLDSKRFEYCYNMIEVIKNRVDSLAENVLSSLSKKSFYELILGLLLAKPLFILDKWKVLIKREFVPLLLFYGISHNNLLGSSIIRSILDITDDKEIVGTHLREYIILQLKQNNFPLVLMLTLVQYFKGKCEMQVSNDILEIIFPTFSAYSKFSFYHFYELSLNKSDMKTIKPVDPIKINEFFDSLNVNLYKHSCKNTITSMCSDENPSKRLCQSKALLECPHLDEAEKLAGQIKVFYQTQQGCSRGDMVKIKNLIDIYSDIFYNENK